MKYFTLLSLVLLWSCSGEEANKTQKSGSSGLKADVVVIKPKPYGEEISASGSILPNEEVELKAEESGRLMQISFKEGSLVSQGSLLFQIDDREFRAQSKNLEVQLELAKKELKRNKALFEVEALSEEIYDASVNKVAGLESQLELIKVRIDRCRIVAPFSGRIGLRGVSPGAFISVGQPLAYLVKENPYKIEFDVPEIYASEIRAGMPLYAVLQGRADTLHAQVYAMEARVNQGSRNLKVRGICESNIQGIMPGSFVNVTLPIFQTDSALLIPAEALIPELNSQKVFKVVNGSIIGQTVNIGKRGPYEIRILSGLQEGDSILVTGILQAREGMKLATKGANQ